MGFYVWNLTRFSEPVSAMGPSGDKMSPELKDLVADSREKSENKVNDVLSKLKGKDNESPVFSYIYHCRISFI